MDWLTVALTGLVAFLIWLLVRRWRQTVLPPGARLPPMPPCASLLGHEQLKKPDFYCNMALKWAKEYGPVYRLRKNDMSIVILNDFASVKDFFSRKEFLYRLRFWVVPAMGYRGVGHICGEAWNANRKFTLLALRDLGLSKSAAMGDIVDEFQCAADKIAESKGEPVPFYDYIMACVSNNITTAAYGHRFPFDHPARKEVDRLVKDLMRTLAFSRTVQLNQGILAEFIRMLPWTRYSKVCDKMNHVAHFASTRVLEHQATADKDFNRDFIDAYLRRVEECAGDPNRNFQGEI